MLDKIITALHSLLPNFITERFLTSITRGGFKKYLKNTGWMFFARIFLMGTNFFVAAYLARYLEPTDFGTYNYIISFVGLFSFIAGLGIDAILSRELLLYKEKRSEILGAAFYIYITSALLALIASNTVAFFTDTSLETKFLIFIFSLTFLFQSSGIFNVYFQSFVQAKKNAIIQIITNIISSLLKIIGFVTGQGILWFIVLFIVEATINALWAFSLFKKMGEKINWTINTMMMKELVRKAFPFMLTIVAASIYLKIDQVMIAHILGVKETGIYSVAVRLAETWYFIPSLICASLFPAIVNAKTTDIKTYYSRIRSLITLMIVSAILLAVPLFIFTPYIITYLYGPLYEGAIIPFQIYIWSSISIFIMPALAAYMTTENLGKPLLMSTVYGAIANVFLNIILIPQYGIIGSALATFISYTIPATYLYIIFTRQEQKIL